MAGAGRLRWCVGAVSLLVVGAACTSSGIGSLPSPRQTQSTPSPSAGQIELSGPCPVTETAPAKQVPETVVRTITGGSQTPLGRHDFDHWFGNDALWVELPPHAEVVKPQGEELSEKFPWVRLIHGFLSIDGYRLDGPAP